MGLVRSCNLWLGSRYRIQTVSKRFSADVLHVWQSAEQVSELTQIVFHTGVGQGLGLIPLAPFVLLFSYKKTYKSVVPDLMIPICGIAFVGLFTVEFVFEMIRLMPTLS